MSGGKEKWRKREVEVGEMEEEEGAKENSDWRRQMMQRKIV